MRTLVPPRRGPSRASAILLSVGALALAGCEDGTSPTSQSAPDELEMQLSYTDDWEYWPGGILKAYNLPNGIDGGGVTVGLIDDGFYEHPDFGYGKLNCLVVGGDNPCTNYWLGHGTLVAGLIDALAPGANIVVCRGGRNAAGLACLNQMASMVDIISISWPIFGGGDYTDDIQAKIDDLYDDGDGILIFAEIDNEWNENQYDTVTCCGTIDFPEGAIAVSGVMPDGKFANWSFTTNQTTYEGYCPEKQGPGISPNTGLSSEWGDASMHGNDVELAGPFYTTSTAVPDGQGNYYRNVCGTSFATPAVAAVAALVMESNPNLSAGEVRDVLRESADDSMISGGGHSPYYGYGIVDAQAAIALANPVPGPSNARVWGPEDWITNEPFWYCVFTVTFDDGVGPFTYEWRYDGSLIGTDSCSDEFNPGPWEGYHDVSVKVIDSLGRYDTDHFSLYLIDF